MGQAQAVNTWHSTSRDWFDGACYGLVGETLAVEEFSADGGGEKWTAPRTFRRDVTVPAHTARAWELRGE